MTILDDYLKAFEPHPASGMPDDFIKRLTKARGKQSTSLDEMRDVLDDLADDMSQAVPENTWTDLL